jgi:hypothetical protein
MWKFRDLDDQQKEKTKLLVILVDRFLEEKFDQEKLMALESKDADYLRESLELILFDEKIWNDPNWKFISDLNMRWINEPDLASEEEVIQENARARAKSFLFLHNLLKRFWEEFKALIFSEQVQTGKTSSSFFDFKFFEEIKINFSVPRESCVHFYPTTLDSIRALQNLIEGTPVEFFKKCKDTTCGKCFIVTSDHKREFCNRKCAARKKQREEREERSEKFKKYHRNYYRIKKGLPPIE